MIRRRVIFLFIVSILMGLTAGFNKKDAGASGNVLTISAQYVSVPPAGLEDPVWQRVKAVHVPVEGRESLNREKGIVSTRVVYSDDQIYFLFRWKDPTRSVIKQSWQYDGKKWSHLKGNEDRLALLFEITRINQFATKGCAVTCHSPADLPKSEWKLSTRTASEKGDLWHWKAARSAPYRHADDAWLTVAGNPTGSYRETGRRKDRGSGGDIKNQTPDGVKPRYMQDSNRNPSAPGFLLFEEAVPIKNDHLFIKGDIIPYRLPVRPSRSRFDVKAESHYSDGHWNLMLSRKLDTGNEDDVAFNPMKRYSFAMAVFDDSGADHSKATKALVLKFTRN